jgi:hypothetical protein
MGPAFHKKTSYAALKSSNVNTPMRDIHGHVHNGIGLAENAAIMAHRNATK